jgi:hypothetical protein
MQAMTIVPSATSHPKQPPNDKAINSHPEARDRLPICQDPTILEKQKKEESSQYPRPLHPSYLKYPLNPLSHEEYAEYLPGHLELGKTLNNP